MKNNIQQTIPITLSSQKTSYVYLGAHSLNQAGLLLQEAKVGKKCLIVTNPKLKKLYGLEVKHILEKAGFTAQIFVVPAGEKYKNLKSVSKILDQLILAKFERNDTVVSLGGGVIGDMAGFAAAIYLRGINLAHLPTSLLAQVDACIGGKTGVDHKSGKNLIGSFYQPLFTLIDFRTLATLPDREIRCGLAEIVKYGFIRDNALIDYIEKKAALIYYPKKKKYFIDMEIWQYLISHSAYHKADVVIKDEKEQNLRATLNFGHTIGHAIEAGFKYNTYLHGEAVAIGMNAAFLIAKKMKMLDQNQVEKAQNLLQNLGFDLKIKKIAFKKIIQKLYLDKKIVDNKIRFVLPTEIGKVVIRNDVPIEVIENVVKSLMR